MLTRVDIQKLPSYQLGREQGFEDGLAQGLIYAKRHIARKLLDKLSDSQIAQTTGLILQEIRNLREDISCGN